MRRSSTSEGLSSTKWSAADCRARLLSSRCETNCGQNMGWQRSLSYTLPEIRERFKTSEVVVIDGVYSHAEEQLLRSEFGEDFRTLAVHSPKAERYLRLGARPHRGLTSAEVDRRDSDEISHLDKARPILLADFHIVNDSTLEGFRKQLARIAARITTLSSKVGSQSRPQLTSEPARYQDDG